MATENENQSLYLTNTDQLKQVFNRFDANNDGKISATELVDVMKSIGSDTSLAEVNRIMSDIDTDRDGFVSLEEFTLFCRGNGGGDGGMKELRDAFEMYDLNKNGLISATELHRILSGLGEGCSVGDCVGMIESVDSDGDGFVNFDEFKKMMTNDSAK